MKTVRCDIGELEKTADNVVILKITCTGEEITKFRMIKAVKAIDSVAEKPSPLLVDASRSHSVSYDALVEMATATNVLAVAIYAPSETSQHSAQFIQIFQSRIGKAPYPFRVFSDSMIAMEWLKTFV